MSRAATGPVMNTRSFRVLAGLGVIIWFGVQSSLARASAGWTDGHIGNGGYIEIGPSPTVGGGVYLSGETASWNAVQLGSSSEHIVIGDARVMASLILGRQQGDEGESANLFALRLEGNAAFGLQAYKVIPLNVSLEDGSYMRTHPDTRGTALLGTTVYLPIQVGQSTDESPVLFLALTAGARWNTELHSGAVFGVQPKVRWMSEDFSAELRYLMTVGNPAGEKKVAAYLARRNIFRDGDEIGISFSKSWSNLPENEWNRGPEVFVFYGINQ